MGEGQMNPWIGMHDEDWAEGEGEGFPVFLISCIILSAERNLLSVSVLEAAIAQSSVQSLVKDSPLDMTGRSSYCLPQTDKSLWVTVC